MADFSESIKFTLLKNIPKGGFCITESSFAHHRILFVLEHLIIATKVMHIDIAAGIIEGPVVHNNTITVMSVPEESIPPGILYTLRQQALEAIIK